MAWGSVLADVGKRAVGAARALTLWLGAFALIAQFALARPHLGPPSPDAQALAALAAALGDHLAICGAPPDDNGSVPVHDGHADCDGFCCQLDHGFAAHLSQPAGAVNVLERRSVRLHVPERTDPPKLARFSLAQARGPPLTV